MISINRFEYNGYSSEDFDLCCQLAFDGDSGEVSTFLSRDAVAQETYNGEIQIVSSYKHTEVLAPKITLIDKNFGDFDLDRQRKILRWLTSKRTPSYFIIYHDDSSVVSYEILGAITELNTQKLGNGRVVGFTGVITSVSPFAYSALQTITRDVSNLVNKTFKIDVDSDNEESAIYPRITIKQKDSVVVQVDHAMINDNAWIAGEDWLDGVVYYYDAAKMYYYQKHYTTKDEKGNTIAVSEPTATQDDPVTDTTKTGVVIKNTYVDENGVTQVVKLKIANNTRNETVVLDGANRIVASYTSDGKLASRVFGDYFNWSWLPLYNSRNQIEVIGNCEVKFEYREPRKIGEF